MSTYTTFSSSIPAAFTTAVLPESPSVLLMLKWAIPSSPVRISHIATLLA